MTSFDGILWFPLVPVGSHNINQTLANMQTFFFRSRGSIFMREQENFLFVALQLHIMNNTLLKILNISEFNCWITEEVIVLNQWCYDSLKWEQTHIHSKDFLISRFP